MNNVAPRRVLLLLTLTALAGCSLGPLSGGSTSPTPSPSQSQSAEPSASPAPSATPSGSPIADPDQALVRIENTGGFVPQEWLFTHYPFAVLYADGRVITQGAQPAIYPGPALPALIDTRLSADGVTMVLAAARQAGLTGPSRTLGQPVPDVGQTIFTVVYPDGTTNQTTLYPELGQPSPDPQAQALLDFESLLMNPQAAMPQQVVGEQPYSVDRLRVISQPSSRAQAPYPSLVTVTDWPLGSLATLGQPLQQFGGTYRCVAISGADLTTLLPTVEAANQATLWKSDGQLYAVIFHPLLPDDPDCPPTTN